MPSLPDVLIYTDGACDPNPGPGGWAVVLQWGGREKELKGGAAHTTNNRMELQAVIAALEALKQPCRITLHTDSTYVQRGVTVHLARWKAQAWQTSAKRDIANRDLWEKLEVAQQRHQITWQWVKGHAGDPLNERVDRLAVSMIPRAHLPLDDQSALHLFTGVSCLGTSGPGAWVAVLRQGAGEELVRSGREPKTSANRLHLLAMAEGLAAVPPGAAVHVYTPSDYAANGAAHWIKAWAAQAWRTKDGQPVKHQELWQAIQAAAQARRVHWHCLKDAERPAAAVAAEARAQQLARQKE